MEKEAEYQEWLPLDIVYQILLRLSVKTLSRFQCVSQTWRSIISNLSFREDHYHRSQLNPLLLVISNEFKLYCDRDDNPVTKTINYCLHLSTYNKEGNLVSKFSQTKLQQCAYDSIQSCLGLICIEPADYGYNNPILLCNPSTKELIALPPTQGYHICIGVGYVASTKEFKVVRFFIRCGGYSHYMEDCCCEVFILGASEWREAKNPPPLSYQFESGAPYLKGGIHLLRSLNISDQHDCIYVFDIDNEEYKTIPFPDFYHREEVLVHYGVIPLYLKEYKGSLYLIFDFKTSLELWCLKDYENREWEKEYIVDLNPLGSEVSAEPIVIMGDGCVLLSIESEKDGASLYCIVVMTKVLRQRWKRKDQARQHYTWKVSRPWEVGLKRMESCYICVYQLCYVGCLNLYYWSLLSLLWH